MVDSSWPRTPRRPLRSCRPEGFGRGGAVGPQEARLIKSDWTEWRKRGEGYLAVFERPPEEIEAAIRAVAARDPQFVAKVRDVVGLYLDPPERAVVLCVDQKSQIQALQRTTPILPVTPGACVRTAVTFGR